MMEKYIIMQDLAIVKKRNNKARHGNRHAFNCNNIPYHFDKHYKDHKYDFVSNHNPSFNEYKAT